jgi:hypothetical protein
VARILGLSSAVIVDATATPPKLGIDDPRTRKEDPADRQYHVPLKKGVAAKLKPVGYIKYVDMTGYVTSPKGKVVRLEDGDGDWGGRKTPGGVVCPSKDINLTIRPRSKAPYCPGGLGGVAKPSWYNGG